MHVPQQTTNRRSVISQSAPQSFVEKLKQQNNATLCVIRTHDHQARACWFLLKTDERRIIKLKCTLHDEMIDLTRFGEVIESGWGAPEKYQFQG